MDLRRKLLLILCFGLAVPLSHAAEEPAPSDKVRDAVGKLNKTPASIGDSLRGLTDAAAAKLKLSVGSSAKPGPTDGKSIDLNVPMKAPAAPAPAHLMKSDSRDPFRPMTLKAKAATQPRENLSPLERLDLGQLKIVGIVWDVKEPRAMIEDSGGLGYTVKVGTPIGSNGGRVKVIRQDQIVVEEYYEDGYGTRKKRDVAMRLSAE
jgi:Tfp pilus assembly protein PilP